MIIPDEVADRAKKAKINVGDICTRALRRELARSDDERASMATRVINALGPALEHTDVPRAEILAVIDEVLRDAAD